MNILKWSAQDGRSAMVGVQRRMLIVLLAAVVASSPAFAAKRMRSVESASSSSDNPASSAPSTATVNRAQLAERSAFSAHDQQRAEIPGFRGVRFWANSEEDYARAVPSQPGPWLILSTGAEDGAYGAGFLSGWTASGHRPEFSVVTGVSSGAIVAIYAFAGAKYDHALQEAYTSINAGDIFEIRATPESLVDTWPLERLIEKHVTPELLYDVAAQHRCGRRLFVVTTNLDAGRAVAWNMGAIAATGGKEALALFRKIVLAAASIPAAFPPVFIEVEADGRRFQEMHVDGGVNGPMYLAPESYLLSTEARPLPASALYVIVNGKLTSEFSQTDRSVARILGRSFSLAMRLGARAQLFLFAQAARRDSIAMKVALIEPDFDQKERSAFDPQYMKALLERGFELGRRGEFQE
jgi:predicted acylesterase/phospholipase RssA